jgi:hypothetical protein
MAIKHIKPELISLKLHPELSEKWVQQVVAEDPSILGLGDVSIKDSERVQPSGGRLDLLLHDPEANRRYEVELQLGASDESHIIRTIEYWDYERRRFPQYEHCAVLVAEDITSRFLNVIQLFNGSIPMVAIQMKALKVDSGVSLIFSTIVDALSLGTEEEDEGEITDRKYWETKASKDSLKIADNLLELTKDFAPGFALKFNKHYIGVASQGVSRNFVSFVPRRNAVILQIKHPEDDEIKKRLDGSDLDILSYDRQWKEYRIRVKDADLKENTETLQWLMQQGYKSYMK